MFRSLFIVALFVILGLSTSNCKKNGTSAGNLQFSQDTILFDTVFTTLGNATRNIRIYNPDKNKIIIEEIELMGGASSPFSINVDGTSADYIENIHINGEDSLFLFAQVILDVNNQNLPMVVEDSIRFRTNGVDQYVHLIVWGQDAYFHVNEVVSGVWNNDKPHIIYGTAAVGYPGIDSNLNLTINSGTQVHFYNESSLIVYKSTLNIAGSPCGGEVVFQGTRLESFYDNLPGQYYGLGIIQGIDCTIDGLIMKNSAYGITVDSTNSTGYALTLTNSIVQQSEFYNLRGQRSGTMDVNNCIFSNAGIYSVWLGSGRDYRFQNVTVANHWSGTRQTPGFVLQNWEYTSSAIYIYPLDNAEFYNCSFTGNIDNEFIIDTLNGGTVNYGFFNCLLKNETPYGSGFTSCLWNMDPLFNDPSTYDFKYPINSPLSGNGTIFAPNLFAIDLDCKARTNPIDIGAYDDPQ
ncbi:MAG: hypothetical protein KDC84_05960 [Crocinitomicaceae bacterium]|nr:hypothetical protein [Crocinitomicaceae bacterium]